MSLNLQFLLHKKLVFLKKVTKSKFVTKFTVTKSEVDCMYHTSAFVVGTVIQSLGESDFKGGLRTGNHGEIFCKLFWYNIPLLCGHKIIMRLKKISFYFCSV